MQKDKPTRSYASSGLWMGAAIPFVVGSIMVINFWRSLPPQEDGMGYCGTGALPGFFIILFGTPFLAMIGTIIGSFFMRK